LSPLTRRASWRGCVVDSSFWIGILPIIVFVILESFTGKRAALVSAVIMAALELIFSLTVYGGIDELTILGFVLVGVAVFLSVKTDNDLFFKFQPVALGVILSLTFFVFYYILDRPLLTAMFDKYMAGSYAQISRGMPKEFFLRILTVLSRDLVFWFLLHAALIAWAALRLSKWWWFAIRVPGFYIILFVACLIAVREVAV